jgi:hypothetical protein
LILLVGGNPLPDAVAAKLLLAEGGTVILIHLKGTFKLSQCHEAMDRKPERIS